MPLPMTRTSNVSPSVGTSLMLSPYSFVAPAVDEAHFAQTLAECRLEICVWRSRTEISNRWDARLLRLRGKAAAAPLRKVMNSRRCIR